MWISATNLLHNTASTVNSKVHLNLFSTAHFMFYHERLKFFLKNLIQRSKLNTKKFHFQDPLRKLIKEWKARFFKLKTNIYMAWYDAAHLYSQYLGGWHRRTVVHTRPSRTAKWNSVSKWMNEWERETERDRKYYTCVLSIET